MHISAWNSPDEITSLVCLWIFWRGGSGALLSWLFGLIIFVLFGFLRLIFSIRTLSNINPIRIRRIMSFYFCPLWKYGWEKIHPSMSSNFCFLKLYMLSYTLAEKNSNLMVKLFNTWRTNEGKHLCLKKTGSTCLAKFSEFFMRTDFPSGVHSI